MTRGFFITLEGSEGSGKSTQAKWLARVLRRVGYTVEEVQDPGSTSLGRRLRNVLLHDGGHRLSPIIEALLFIAGRAALVEERVRPAVARGAVVISDRFHDSTMAYQGSAGQLDVRWLDDLGRRAIGGTMPDLTIVLDVPTREGFARLRRSKDRIERKPRQFHERVRRGFLAAAKREPRRVVVVDATQPADAVHDAIVQIVHARLSRGQRGGAR